MTPKVTTKEDRTMATEAKDVKDVRAELLEATQKKADEQNATRTGKGTRLRVGQTRGKNPQVITWEAFDESQPDSLPATLAEFMEISGVKDEKPLVGFLIDGFNSQAYGAASDPIAEFINPAWDEETQSRFRVTVRNYAAMLNVAMEEAVALIKPGVEKAFASKKA
jgi:hypothetical protein